MSCKTASQGAKLQYDLDNTPPYTDIAHIVSIDGPDIEVDVEEETELDNAEMGRWKEFCANFIDGGEITAEVYFTKAKYTLFLGTLLAATYHYRVVFPLLAGEASNSYIQCQGIMRRLGNTIPEKGRIKTPIGIKVSGQVFFTEGV